MKANLKHPRAFPVENDLKASPALVFAFGGPVFRTAASCALVCLSICSRAQEPTSKPPTATVERVEITAKHPGPGLWKVVNGSNVLWIMGTHTPVMKDLKWSSAQVDAAVRGAQEVLGPPKARPERDLFSVLHMISMIPAAMSFQDNPDGKRLQDRLEAPLHARWLKLRERYLPVDSGGIEEDRVEYMRPWAASMRLYKAALEQEGLVDINPVWEHVSKLAKRHRVRVTEVRHGVPTSDVRRMMDAQAAKDMDDIGCFEATLAQIEADLPALRTRATAWARGDLQTLASIPIASRNSQCGRAARSSDAAKALDDETSREKLRTLWLDHAERVLRDHRASVAVLPIIDLNHARGKLQALRERGYTVVAPE